MAKRRGARRDDPLANVVGVRAYEDLFALIDELDGLIFKLQARLTATAPAIAPDEDTT